MPNRLIHETSPYLLQHAHNPVDWYPWGEEAQAIASGNDKPILLSVGYSACHWCHVMEHESFEDEVIAAQMNRDFVCVKLDREERPDLDKVYMKAVQAFTGGHGGWPMTLFLTPDGRPFLGGTYFPPVARGGMPSFPQLMERATALWRDERARVEEIAGNLTQHIGGQSRLPAPGELQAGWLEAVAEAASAAFDEEIPGLGAAPRFPRPWTIAALMAHWRRTGWGRSLQMAVGLLDVMASGGMYDVVGGGFARYSVDREWLIPHFEKMLYDNAQLAPLYVDAWLATGEARHARVARETLDFVLRELRDASGGFTSALDADSLNGAGASEEGFYYTWTQAELIEALGESDGARAAPLLAVTAAGNFEHGRSALRPPAPLESLSQDDRAFLERVYPVLMAAREERARPGLDDKVITAWNGLMIAALARGGAALDEPRYTLAAREAADFLLDRVVVDGRLRRNWKLDPEGRERLGAPGFLDDHAFLLHGLIELYEATFDAGVLDAALALADRTVALFWDESDVGFFYTGADVPAGLGRQKPLLGSALPGGNEMAAWAFCRLETLCGRADLGDRAERVLASLQKVLPKAPLALGPATLAAAWRTGTVQEVALTAEASDPEGAALLTEVRRRYQPFRVVARVAPGPVPATLPWMDGRADPGSPATAYVCVDRACLLPARQVDELAEQLDGLDAPTDDAPQVDSGLSRIRLHAPELPTDPAAWLNAPTPLTLERLRGNIVVLDFWTSCCINCLHILPELAAVEARFAGEPVAVIGVHSAKFTAEKEVERVQQAMARHGVHHPVVVDPEHTLWQQYTVRSWPTVTVLDAAGRIAFNQSGEVDRATLIRVVESLLEEARASASLAEPAWTPSIVPAGGHADSDLRFPGKVHVYPSELEQARGADPLDGGRLYVADTGNHRIIEAALSRGADGWPAARALRAFGDGEPGLVDGARPRFRGPQGMARAGDSLWVADTENHALRRIDLSTGEAITAAGTGRLGRGQGQGGDPTRPRSVDLRSPWDVAIQEDVVFIAMAGAHQIWIYMEDRDQLGPFAGSGREDHIDGNLEESALAQPSGLSLLGNYLFFADSETSSVRVLELHRREIGTLVGKGLFDFGDVDGPTSEALLQHPLGVTSDPEAAWVADTFNGKIKRVDLGSREVSTVAAGFSEPGGLARAGDYLIVADTNAHGLKVVHRETGEVRPLALQLAPLSE